nr:MAG TPA: hypothetical protein [Caudoviricetes sp.]
MHKVSYCSFNGHVGRYGVKSADGVYRGCAYVMTVTNLILMEVIQ